MGQAASRGLNLERFHVKPLESVCERGFSQHPRITYCEEIGPSRSDTSNMCAERNSRLPGVAKHLMASYFLFR